MTGQELARTGDPVYDAKLAKARVLSNSALVPEYFRGKPEETLIAGLALEELGVEFGPNTLKMVYVIGGKPGYMAQLQIALAARDGHEIVPVDSECTATSAKVRVRKRGDTVWQDVTFTMEDARRAGLTGNKMYDKWPSNMLLARCCTRAISRYIPGSTLGIDNNVQYPSQISAPALVASGAGSGGTEPAGPGTAADERPTREPADAHPPARQPATHPRNAGHGDQGEPGTGRDAPHETPGVAPTDEQIQRIQEALANMDGDGRAELNRRLGNFPKFGSDSFTAAHAQRTLLELGLIGAIPEAEA